MPVLLVISLAVALAAATYFGIERLGRPGALPAALRVLTYSVVGLLLINVSCERPPERARPIVLLDASLSMARAAGGWDAARQAAASLGEVRFASAANRTDSTPTGGRSSLAPDLIAAAASGRPVWVVTDGVIDDADEIPDDLRRRIGVRLVAPPAGPDFAITRVAAPDRIAAGDTLHLEIEIAGLGGVERREVAVEVRSGARRWLTSTVTVGPGLTTVRLEGPLPRVEPGARVVEVSLPGIDDAEPRTDARLAVIAVTPTPGVVVVASPGGWDSKFLFRALADVAALPVRGYLDVGGGHWRRMGDLAAVTATEVEQAATRADLLVLFGDPEERFRRVPVTGRWVFVATARASAPAPGDWYLGAGGASPISGAFIGLPLDSFPPASGLVALTPGPRDWTGLTAQLNRRGTERPAVTGRDSAGRREVAVGVGGLWRWAFRGGASEQAYRAWVAATTSWLLGGVDSAAGQARPVRTVVAQGRPLIFERTRADSTPLAIQLSGDGGARTDTLRFDGAGRAELNLPPGAYRYRIAGGGAGLVAVEQYTDEWIARPPVLEAREAAPSTIPAREPLRDLPWIFAIAIVALSGEWWWRRRAGLR